MKKIWEVIGSLAVKVAFYALEHPDKVEAVVKIIKEAR